MPKFKTKCSHVYVHNIIRRIEYDTKKEKKELLYEKLAELPEEDQDLYRLYFTEGYSQEEIAVMKGVSQNTISKKLRRIARQLTEMCRNEV